MMAASTSLVPTARATRVKRRHWLHGDAFDVEFFDAGDLLELIEGSRAPAIDGDRFVGEVFELLQAFGKADIGGDDFGILVETFLARLRRDCLDHAFAGEIECSRGEARETEIGGAGCERFATA